VIILAWDIIDAPPGPGYETAMAFGRLNDILRVLGAKYPQLSRRIHEAQALGHWEKAVGPVIAKHARAIRVENGVLWVEVDHPAWKSELHHRKQQVLEKLNAVGAAQGSTSAVQDILLLDPRRARDA